MSYNKDKMDPTMMKIIAGLVIFVILVGGSLTGFERLNTNMFGLDRNVLSGEVSTDQVYESGMHWIGLMHEFIEFPSTQQTIQFYTSEGNQITGRTQDGLAIALDISFQYQLSKEGIIELYSNFGEEYEAVFFRIARDITRDVASLFTAIEFFSNRTHIGTEMENIMVTQFYNEFKTNIPGFQLLQIDLPDTFEAALEAAEVARQQIAVARLEQEEALIRAETKILEAQAAANVTLVEATAEAEAFLIIINAQAEAVNITLSAQTDSYYALSQVLNLTASELLAFLWIQALVEIGEYGNLIILGDNTPFITITQPDNSTSNP